MAAEHRPRTLTVEEYFELEKQNPEIYKEYILVSATTMKMEMYRKEAGKWVYSMFNAEDELELTSIDLHFPVKEAYVDVELAENPSEKE